MTNLPVDGTPLAADPLTRAVLEIDEYSAGLGWDQPARLFALVDTAKLREQEPSLAAQLGIDDSTTASLTPVEQDEIPAGVPLDEFLATIAWPDAVAGCALTVERLMLPPSAEDSEPAGMDEAQLAKWVARAPGPPGGPDDGGRTARRTARVGAAAAREGLHVRGAHRLGAGAGPRGGTGGDVRGLTAAHQG